MALECLPDMARDRIHDGGPRIFVAVVRNQRGAVLYRATLSLKGDWVHGPETATE